MPQLDKFAFVSQVLWLVCMFVGIYILVLGSGLPRIYKVLKFRRVKLVRLRERLVKAERRRVLVEQYSGSFVRRLVGLLGGVAGRGVALVGRGVEEIVEQERMEIGRVRSLVIGGILDEEKMVQGVGVSKMVDESEYLGEVRSLVSKKVVEG